MYAPPPPAWGLPVFPLHKGVAELLRSLPREGPDRHFVYLRTTLPEAVVYQLLARTELGEALCSRRRHPGGGGSGVPPSLPS